MSKRVETIVRECIGDLGITIVYALLAGVLIVAVVTTDQGTLPLLRIVFYASLLPTLAALLVGSEVVLRIIQDWRALRRAKGFRQA